MYLTAADPSALWIQGCGALLFAAVFAFLWRRSGVIYFALWSVAWTVQAGALASAAAWLARGSVAALSFYAILRFTFAMVLLAAARAGISGSFRGWRGPLKVLMVYPIFLSILYVLDWGAHLALFDACTAAALVGIFIYNSAGIHGSGLGNALFRFSLLAAAALHLYVAVAYFAGRAPLNTYYELLLYAGVTFTAAAMWIDNQQDRLREIGTLLDRVRRENLANLDLDYLTGLLNQSALSRRMDEENAFYGVVSVCDMDNFKEVNDRYGHLVGDEILRAVGHLLRTSVRPEDEAFRWGGDEFVVFFHNQDRAVAQRRMEDIARRLRDFRVRGHGILPITFSWGIADGSGRPLREVLDEADRSMYALKRGRR